MSMQEIGQLRIEIAYLIRRIKKCVQEIDMDMIIKMFDNLPQKIIQAKNNGFQRLL